MRPRFSPHDPGRYVPMRTPPDDPHDELEHPRVEVHELGDDDCPVPESEIDAAPWCDEEEDRCSPLPMRRTDRAAQERPEPTVQAPAADDDCRHAARPRRDVPLAKGPSVRPRRCGRTERDPLW